jgi:hypoxanthine-DNA glycosylase
MPSVRSLQKRQYYAHAQNAFWPLAGEIYGFEQDAPYADRVSALTDAGVAVWDVLHDCIRPGSLDQNIARESEQANDFSGLFRELEHLRLIAFNGKAASQIFMRHCGDLLAIHDQLTTVVLPSSSPAHAALNLQEKLEIWQSLLLPYQPRESGE